MGRKHTQKGARDTVFMTGLDKSPTKNNAKNQGLAHKNTSIMKNNFTNAEMKIQKTKAQNDICGHEEPDKDDDGFEIQLEDEYEDDDYNIYFDKNSLLAHINFLEDDNLFKINLL